MKSIELIGNSNRIIVKEIEYLLKNDGISMIHQGIICNSTCNISSYILNIYLKEITEY